MCLGLLFNVTIKLVQLESLAGIGGHNVALLEDDVITGDKLTGTDLARLAVADDGHFVSIPSCTFSTHPLSECAGPCLDR